MSTSDEFPPPPEAAVLEVRRLLALHHGQLIPAITDLRVWAHHTGHPYQTLKEAKDLVDLVRGHIPWARRPLNPDAFSPVHTDSPDQRDLVLRHLATTGEPDLAFVVDRRYILEDDFEHRLAVSIGKNITGHRGILAPPLVHGPLVMGLHDVGTQGHQIGITDQWQTARPYPFTPNRATAEAAAKAWLATITDDEYEHHLSGTIHTTPHDLDLSRYTPSEEW